MATSSSTKISCREEAAWLHDLVLRGGELDFPLSRLDGFCQHAEYCRRCARQGLANLCGPQVMREKKCRDGVACAVHSQRQPRGTHHKAAALVRGEKIDAILRRILRVQRSNKNCPRPDTMDGFDGIASLAQRSAGTSAEIVQLELVGRDEIGGRNGPGPHELRNAFADKDSTTHVANDRIAAIFRRWIGALYSRHRIENSGTDIGRAHITRQNAVAFAEHAALLDARHQLGDHACIEYAALPTAITGVVGELHRVDGPDLHPDPLQRKHCGGISDVSVSNVRLDGQNIHRGGGLLSSCLTLCRASTSLSISQDVDGTRNSGLPELRKTVTCRKPGISDLR